MMNDVSYIGHKVVPILDFTDLVPEDQESAKDLYFDPESLDYFYYRGTVYTTSDFEMTSDPQWDGKLSETYFSSVMVKFGENNYGDKIANVAVLCV